MALGAVVNRAVDRKKPVKTKRWLMAEDEAGAIGSAVGLLATRRIPAELTEGDGEQVLGIAVVLIGYAVRNLLNVSPDELAAASGGGPVPATSYPVPVPVAQQPAQGWPTAPEHRVQPQPAAPFPAPPPPPAPVPVAPAPRIASGFDGIDEPASQASEVVAQLSGDAL
jgi:hypothetical protein